jgi:hypothetical protein
MGSDVAPFERGNLLSHLASLIPGGAITHLQRIFEADLASTIIGGGGGGGWGTARRYKKRGCT